MTKVPLPPDPTRLINKLKALHHPHAEEGAEAIRILDRAIRKLAVFHEEATFSIESLVKIILKIQAAGEAWETLLKIADKNMPENEYIKDIRELNLEQKKMIERDAAEIMTRLTL